MILLHTSSRFFEIILYNNIYCINYLKGSYDFYYCTAILTFIKINLCNKENFYDLLKHYFPSLLLN